MKVVSLPTATVDEGVIGMLQQALEHATKSKAHAIAIVISSPDDIATMYIGDAISLNYGLDLLKAGLLGE